MPQFEPFGSTVPFAEPSWYNGLCTPYYKDKHVRLRQEARTRVDETLIPFAHEWESKGEVPREVFLKHAREGYLASAIFPLPADHLGDIKLPAGIPAQEWDIWCDLINVDEATRVGYLGVNWALGGGNGIGAPPLVVFGNREQKDRLLKPIVRGEKRICLGITEPNGGSDVASILSTATPTADGKGYVLNGRKKWITNAIMADYMTTAVRTGPPGSGNKGISVMVVDLNQPGVTRRHIDNTGVHASGSTYVELDNVFVPKENLLGKENKGFPIVMTNFLHERLVLCVQANRMSRICIEDAYEYACERKTFGKPLISQPIIRDKFANMGRVVEANHAWIEQLCYHMEQVPKDQADRDLAGFAALLKISCTRGLEYCNREALQVLGGIGYQRGGRGGRIEQISRDVRVMCVGGGSDEIMGDLGLRMAEMLGRLKASRM